MTEPRLSTVYDYSDLRLHPDGTRVYQKSTNLRPALQRVTVQNSRANWIAKDAGGPLNIRQFKPAKATLEDPQEEDVGSTESQVDIEADHTSVDETEESPKQTRKHKLKRPDGRKAKRQKFANNYDYLSAEASTSNNAVPVPNVSTPVNPLNSNPSSDLLKCIHRFASEYYTETGQLLNASRTFRKERKEKRLLRLEKQKAKQTRSTKGLSGSSRSTSSHAGSPKQDTEDEIENDTDDEKESENENDAGRTEVDDQKSKAKQRAAGKGKGRRRAEKHHVDMYKVLDGSAMLAVGMLVQEYIAHLLNPQAPPGWEDQVKEAYGSGYADEELHDEAVVDEEDEEFGVDWSDQEDEDFAQDSRQGVRAGRHVEDDDSGEYSEAANNQLKPPTVGAEQSERPRRNAGTAAIHTAPSEPGSNQQDELIRTSDHESQYSGDSESEEDEEGS
ncbi:hypothetical protein B0H34DRAFT_794222 [Crassisporium funariophilum]|nr:hypothetical protein B0H34DRAFT_794222 [Crassisporium funariophilum]